MSNSGRFRGYIPRRFGVETQGIKFGFRRQEGKGKPREANQVGASFLATFLLEMNYSSNLGCFFVVLLTPMPNILSVVSLWLNRRTRATALAT
jgi:hypothetical protein